MNNNSLVSIIMNCYNGSRFLREAIDSVYAQTYQNWEIIFWDNTSTDSSAQIAQSYDKRLKYFLSETFTTLGEARELAVRNAEGEYFAFLDCDDYWHCEKLGQQIPLFQDPDVGLVYSNYWIKNLKRKKISSKNMLPTGFILNNLLNNYSVGFLTVVVRREVVENSPSFFDTRYDIIHDFDLIIRISVKWKFSCIQTPLAYYRYHSNNETVRKIDQYIKELEIWIKENQSNSKIGTQKSFYRQQDVLMYLKGVELVKKRKRIQALLCFYNLSICVEKFKLFLIIFLPKNIFHLFKLQ